MSLKNTKRPEPSWKRPWLKRMEEWAVRIITEMKERERVSRFANVSTALDWMNERHHAVCYEQNGESKCHGPRRYTDKVLFTFTLSVSLKQDTKVWGQQPSKDLESPSMYTRAAQETSRPS